MQSLTLSQMIERVTPYDEWRAPFDPRLRRAGFLCFVPLIGLLLIISKLPFILDIGESNFLLILRGTYHFFISSVHEFQFYSVGFTLANLVILIMLLIPTRGFQTGKLVWHWVMLSEILMTASLGLLISLVFAIISANLIAWVVIAIVTLVLVFLALFAVIFILSLFFNQ